MEKEQMNIVIVGHVDHGKSTVIGRLLADTNALPSGKLESVKERCKRESKEFEYAFLLDALHDEQDQGITIDSARCFFKSAKRDYIIIDAPGHIEFLKNMISGAARAEAALLVIDAKEGIQENSKRHAYMLSMLGIDQVAVVVNKMDLVDYSKEVFEKIKSDYTDFLKDIGIEARTFIPVSALKGDNIVSERGELGWFSGGNVLEVLDSFSKEKEDEEKPFRMPVQGVYKFTSKGDSRRIIAGRVESGKVKVGDKVIFLPSHKKSEISSIESFNTGEKKEAFAGECTGVTLKEQVYVNRGDVMCVEDEKLPFVSTLLKANIFWMGKAPMSMEKKYKLKLGTKDIPVKLKEINSVLDASNLESSKRETIERHEVAECLLECQNEIAYDLSKDIESTGRFVIVDDYNIAGGGIVSDTIEDEQAKVREQVFLRDERWYESGVDFRERALRYGQRPKTILITGPSGVDKKKIARSLERLLFERGRKVYYLVIGNLLRGLDADIGKENREEHIRRMGEVAHILMEAGLMVVQTASDLSAEELRSLQTIVDKRDIFVVDVGGNLNDGIVDLSISGEDSVEVNVMKIMDMLKFKNVMFDY
ncbi:GTP-binding protein [Candidatus Woesearchaeota archaeon]|nr:GTP-binding protein [Candidatus Woesearchaeota archaeon]